MTIGVLPVPPTVRFPTLMPVPSRRLLRNKPRRYKAARKRIAPLYVAASGRSVSRSKDDLTSPPCAVQPVLPRGDRASLPSRRDGARPTLPRLAPSATVDRRHREERPTPPL